MREILFRGKRLQGGEWVEGYFYKSDRNKCERESGKAMLIFTPDCDTFIYISEAHNSVMVTSETVGQYTGLTDKNGKKIFAGDIVKTKEYGRDCGNGLNCAGYDTFLVKFDGGHYCLTNKNRVFYLTSNSKVEVIGNIHDNPELLDGGDNGEKV